MESEKITLDNIGNGAAKELFDHELEKVLRNIQDPNTRATEMRRITIMISIAPTEERDSGAIEVKCMSKLAGIKPVVTPVFMGKEHGQMVAYQTNPNQFELPFKKEQVAVLPGGQQ